MVLNAKLSDQETIFRISNLPCISCWSIESQENLLKCEWKWSESGSVGSDSLWLHGLYSPWNSPGQNTGVGSHSLLQGIFPTQGFNPGLSHCRRILYQLSRKGSPRILEWVAYPFSSESSRPRNQTGVSCIAGGFFLPTELWGKILLEGRWLITYKNCPCYSILH